MKENKIDYSIYYRKWHDESTEHFESLVPFYRRLILPYVGDNKDINILDVGCGFGLAIYSLRKLGYKNIKGIDISPQQVKVAQSKGLDVTLVDNTLEYLKDHTEQFDIVLLLDVLEHTNKEEQIPFLKSINGSLKAGGKLILTVPNANSTLACRWRYNDWTHYISFTEHSLEFLLLNSGFSKVEIKEMEYLVKPKLPFIPRKSVCLWFLFKFVRFLRRLEAIAELGYEGKKIPLSLNIIGVAYK